MLPDPKPTPPRAVVGGILLYVVHVHERMDVHVVDEYSHRRYLSISLFLRE